MNKAQLQYNLEVVVLKEGNRFVAFSPALDLSTSGKTVKEAQRRFTEAAEGFFEVIIERDTVDKTLGDLGWQKFRKAWTPPKIVSQLATAIRVQAMA